jgi:hypothetical protein
LASVNVASTPLSETLMVWIRSTTGSSNSNTITAEQALDIIAERYIVPDDVRRRTNKRARRKRAQRRAERQGKKKRSRSR